MSKPTTNNRQPTAVFCILLLVIACWLLVSTSIVFAQEKTLPVPEPKPTGCVSGQKDGVTEYCLLEPLPLGLGNTQVNKVSTKEYLPGLFRLIIGIAGVLAVLRIIWGGVQYMSTDAWSGKNEAKGTIENALWGLILAMMAWLIVYTINPKLVEFNLSLTPIKIGETSIPPGSGIVGEINDSVKLTREKAFNQLKNAGVNVLPVILDGVRQGTINEIINLKKSCPDCDITVTSATGGVHAPGVCSHGNGWKVDLRISDRLNNFIADNYTKLPDRNDGAQMYRSPRGSLYAKEGNHWDVVVPCSQ